MRSTNCAVQAVKNMAVSIEKRLFTVKHYVETDTFRTTQTYYSHRFERSVPAKSVTWKFVKEFRQTENVYIQKIVRRLLLL
jgi:hypothetical protein